MMETVSNKVLSVGLCCLDIVMVCNSYPKEDSDQRCLSHKWQRGGNASNSATIFSEFGLPCEILGTMSTDIGGQFMKNDFQLHKISFENCHFFDEFESPVSTVWINAENGSRTIVHSNKPYYDEIKTIIEYIRQWNCNHVENKIRISIEVEKPRIELGELITLGDVVFISKDFAAACGFSNMTSAVESLYHRLRPGGVLICAWGDQGASAKMSDGATYVSEAYAPFKIVNTLGAGDTFVAATIISLIRGDNLDDALHIGCRVAGTKCGMDGVRGLAQLCPYLKLY